MAKSKVIEIVKCDTVGDLLDVLSEIAKDPNRWDLLSASIESSGEVFDRFRITQDTLSDKSIVLNFEFMAVDI